MLLPPTPAKALFPTVIEKLKTDNSDAYASSACTYNKSHIKYSFPPAFMQAISDLSKSLFQSRPPKVNGASATTAYLLQCGYLTIGDDHKQ